MDIDNMDQNALLEEVKAHGVEVHHKTGESKLRAILKQLHEGTFDKEAGIKEVPKEAPKVELTKEQRAMRLIRIVVVPNDPLLASYTGLIFSVGSSKVNKGRMIKKYVPFNNEEGWHVPHIIYEQIKNAEMQKFKSTKLPNGEKVLTPYLTKKFNVQVLDPLSEEELAKLAASQKARGGL